jgi:hypothetical protein
MLKKIVLTGLLLSNLGTGYCLWNTHRSETYWRADSIATGRELMVSQEQLGDLQEAIASEGASSSTNRLKLHVLAKTRLGQCIFKNPGAEEKCGSPDWVTRSYQRVLQRSSDFPLEMLDSFLSSVNAGIDSNKNKHPTSLSQNLN